MFATNERDARAAYHRWLGQGPSGPYAIDFIEAMTDKEGEMMEHLATFMFRAGVEFKEHVRAVETVPQFQVIDPAYHADEPDLASAVARASTTVAPGEDFDKDAWVTEAHFKALESAGLPIPIRIAKHFCPVIVCFLKDLDEGKISFS